MPFFVFLFNLGILSKIDEGSFSASTSPCSFSINKGYALMMVSWSNAQMEIRIPDLSRTVAVSPTDGYSLFTFKNNAEIKIKFQSSIKFYVASCPQYSSTSGAVQYFCNIKDCSISADKLKKDVYFSTYSAYSISGSISQGFAGRASFKYYTLSTKEWKETKDLSNLNIDNIYKTSYIYRPIPLGELSYSGLVIKEAETYSHTNTSATMLQWDSVQEDNNNFKENMAYGGFTGNKNYVEKQISSFPSLKYTLNLTLSFSSEGEILIVPSSGTPKTYSIPDSDTLTFSSSEPLNYTFSIKAYKCSDWAVMKTIEITNTGTTSESLDDSDIPDKCEPQYTVSLSISITCKGTLTYGKKGIESTVSTPISVSYGYSINQPFIFFAKITVGTCVDTLMKEINVNKAGTTFIDIDDSDIPDKCITKHYVKIKNSITFAGAEITIKDKSFSYHTLESGEIYSDSGISSFSVSIYIHTQYCTQTLIKTVDSSTTSSTTTISDSDIPISCKVPASKYPVCLIPSVSSQYNLGYKDLSHSSTSINPLTSKINLTNSASFSVELYLTKSPLCKPNQLLKTYTASSSSTCQTITDNDIPSQCKHSDYLIWLKTSYSSDYSLGYIASDDKDETMKNLGQTGTTKLSRNYPFYITLYLTSSPKCGQTAIKKIDASFSEEYQTINDNIILEKCRKPEPPTHLPSSEPEKMHYTVCMSNRNIHNPEIVIYYTLSYEDYNEKHYFTQELIEISSNNSFTANVYLEKSPICPSNYLLSTQSSIFVTRCSYFNNIYIPEHPSQCGGSSDISTKDKSIKSNTVIIAASSIAGVVVVGVIVATVLVITRKKKKDDNFKSEKLTESLIDNINT